MKTCTALICIFILSISTYAQLTVKDQEATPNTLLQVNDEGNAGSITLPPLSAIGTFANKLYNIGSILYWNGITLGTSGSAAGWTDLGSNVILSTLSDKVGIGTSTPSASLHVSGNDGVLFTGNNSGIIPVEGDGTRLMWYPKKAALRVGTVVGPDIFTPSSNWNDVNIGYGSIAMGFNTTASGLHSFAVGGGTSASGDNSTAIGGGTIASGNNSTAMGIGTIAASLSSTAIGYNNIGGGTADAWIDTEPLFEIGNGITMTPSNALTVLKNGNLGIGIHNPSYKLDINGGNLLVRGADGFTSTGHEGIVHLGSIHSYIKAEYGYGVKIGAYAAQDAIAIKELSGNVGINTTSPAAKLDVNGTVKIGDGGTVFSEIKKITGTTEASGYDTFVSYPSGYTENNTHILSLEVYFPNNWVSIGYYDITNSVSLHCLTSSSALIIRHGPIFNAQPYRLVLMKIN